MVNEFKNVLLNVFLRVFHFSNSVINHWNSLDFNQVHACLFALFKRNLICVV